MPPRPSRADHRSKATPLVVIDVDDVDEEAEANSNHHHHHSSSSNNNNNNSKHKMTSSTNSSPMLVTASKTKQKERLPPTSRKSAAQTLSSSSPPLTHKEQELLLPQQQQQQQQQQQKPPLPVETSSPHCSHHVPSTPVPPPLPPPANSSTIAYVKKAADVATTTTTMKVREGYLDDLDELQRAAVCADPDRPLLLQAGAGSGKTHTMASRIAHLILHHHVPPYRILCFCFTRQAAFTLQQRVEQLLQREVRRLAQQQQQKMRQDRHSNVDTMMMKMGGNGDTTASTLLSQPLSIKVKTMHAFGLECLRRFGALPLHTEVIDVKKQRKLAKQVVETYIPQPVRHTKESRRKLEEQTQDLILFINNQKNEATQHFKPNAKREQIRMFQAYEDILHKEMLAVDFGDLQYMFYDLLRPKEVTTEGGQTDATASQTADGEKHKEQSKVCVALRRRYTHIIIDEFQDLNAVQFEVAALLAGDGDDTENNNNNNNNNSSPNKEDNMEQTKHNGVCRVSCVGDPNQSIYGWRGAVKQSFVRWKERFPQSIEMCLRYNYRSLPHIVHVANRIVKASQQSFYGIEEGKKRLLAPKLPHEEESATAKKMNEVEEDNGTSINNNSNNNNDSSKNSGHLDMSSLVTMMDDQEQQHHPNPFTVKLVHAAGVEDDALDVLRQLLHITCTNVYTDDCLTLNKQTLFSLPSLDNNNNNNSINNGQRVPSYNYSDVAILCRKGELVNKVVHLLKENYLPYQLIRHMGSSAGGGHGNTNISGGGQEGQQQQLYSRPQASPVAFVMALLRLIVAGETATTPSEGNSNNNTTTSSTLQPLLVPTTAYDTQAQNYLNNNNNNNNNMMAHKVNHRAISASLRPCNEDIRTIISSRLCPKLCLTDKSIEPFLASLESLVEEQRQKHQKQPPPPQQQQEQQQERLSESSFYDIIKNFVFCNFSTSLFPKLSSTPKTMQKKIKYLVEIVEEGRRQLCAHQHQQQQRQRHGRSGTSACTSAEQSHLCNPVTDAKLRALHQCGLLLQQLLRHIVMMTGLDGSSSSGTNSKRGPGAAPAASTAGAGKRSRAGDSIVDAVSASFRDGGNSNSKSNGHIEDEEEGGGGDNNNNNNNNNNNISSSEDDEEEEERKTLLNVLLEVLAYLQTEMEQEIKQEEDEGDAAPPHARSINEEEESGHITEEVNSHAFLLRFLDQFLLLSEDDDDTNALLRILLRKKKRQLSGEEAGMAAAERKATAEEEEEEGEESGGRWRRRRGLAPTIDDIDQRDALLPEEALLRRHFTSRKEQQKQTRAGQRGKISVGTVHAAKGMEWPLVFLPGCNVGGFPVSVTRRYGAIQSMADYAAAPPPLPPSPSLPTAAPGGAVAATTAAAATTTAAALAGCKDEERRIFYVAMSRAQTNAIGIIADAEEPSILIQELIEGGGGGDTIGDHFPVEELVCTHASRAQGGEMRLVRKPKAEKKVEATITTTTTTAKMEAQGSEEDKPKGQMTMTQDARPHQPPPPPPTRVPPKTTPIYTAPPPSANAVQWLAPGAAPAASSGPRRTTMTYRASK